MWALGCVLYEMCTLHVPFNAKDFDSLVMKIMTGQFDPLPRYSTLYKGDSVKVV